MAEDQEASAAAKAMPGNATAAKQIRALMKKNMKIHMRTSAVPCCPCCGLVNACFLHFCCPIFFVLCATFVPWVIIKSTLSEAEAKDFFEVRTLKSKVFKDWPEFDMVNQYKLDEIGYQRTQGRTETVPFGIAPLEYHLWAPKPFRTYDWLSGTCYASARGCHCKTLALIGPSAVVGEFKTLLQREAGRFWANYSAIAGATKESWQVLNQQFKSGQPFRRLSPEGENGLPSSAFQRLQSVHDSIKEAVGAAPGALADLLADSVPARRLSNGSSSSSAPSSAARDRAGRRQAWEECLERRGPILESDYCDVDPGHNGTIFRTFASREELDRFMESSEYGRYSRNRSESSPSDRLCGAVIFENDALTASVPAYTIRVNVTEEDVDYDEITSRRTEARYGDRRALRFYSMSGFLYLQHLVHTLLAEKRGGAAPTPDLLRGSPHVVPAPTLEEFEWDFGGVVGMVLGNPLVFTMMFGPIVASIAFYMSKERATRQRELMRMMGLSDASLLWSWVLMFVGFNFFITLVMTIFLRAFFLLKSDFFIVWMVVFWFANATVSFGMFVAAWVSSERMSAMSAVGMFLGVTFLTPVVGDNSPTGMKALLSLLPPDGFLLTMGIIWDWELAGLGATFATSNSYMRNYSVGLGIGMLFVSFWLWLLLYYYVDNVASWHNIGVPRKPWFCFTGSYWREVMGKAPVVAGGGSGDLEAGQGSTTADPKYVEGEEDVHLKQMVESDRCVIVRNLCKSFVNAAGEKVNAVKDLSLTMYQDECFCLLGHNGAGKTTTMMMLTGCLPQSSGQIKVKGCRIPEQVRAIRTSMGFCPQHNVLFNELTVFEHLEIFGTLGGMSPERIRQRGTQLVVAVALADKMHTRAAALSGGMKRKLSAALAFLSEPYLVILDEPSSGMDPFARRGMWNTLKQWRTGHILCLTTHYMDEADALGDRIAIMSNGQLACKGSSTFLKRQFGCGYVISFAKVDDSPAHNSKILGAVRAVLGGDAEIMSAVGKELLVQVPFAAAEKFPTLFPQIDASKGELGIESYGTSVTNLEEVFLRVAHMEKKGANASVPDKAAETTWASPETPGGTKQASFMLQLKALLIRRVKFGYRNRLTCACQIGLPIMCLFMFCLITVVTTVTALDPLVLDTSRWNLQVEQPRVPVTIGTMQSTSAAFRSEVQAMWTNAPGIDAAHFVSVAPATYAVAPNSSASIITGVAEESGFAKVMLANERRHAASQYAGILYPDTSSWCLASRPDVCPAVGVTIMVNLTAPHAGPTMFNAHAAAVLRRRSTGITNIQVTNYPFPKVEAQRSRMQLISDILAAVIIMAAYGFVPSGVTSYVVMEKEKEVKNQLIISGCSYGAYWLSNFIFDVFWGLIPAIGAWVTFYIWGLRSYTESPGIDASVALFLAFLPAMAGFAYLFSFLFSKSGVALFFSWIFNLSVGVLATIVIAVLRGFDSTYNVMVALRWIFRMVPVFSLGYGHLLIGANQQRAKDSGKVGGLAGLGVGGGDCEDPATVSGTYRADARCIYMVGDEFMMLVIFGVIFMVLTIAMDTVCGLPVFKRIFGSGPGLPGRIIDSNEDEMVLEEKTRVGSVNRTSQFVFVQNVHKVYNRGFHAVRGISFAASDGQVFGLLGVNGAGKTTTFKMLCGQVEPTAGEICIQGYDISTQTAQARRLIGYCPQFDALLDSLTTREHLYLYGRMKGLDAGEVQAAVTQQLSDLDLNSYVKSRAGQLSGGNKRKLSVAMATIAEPPMVFLDEPSAGMDPVARRGMWSVIQNIADKRKRSVVILTTHSMEEAEALCSRIAIQVDGQFRCLGTAQQIKSRYGQGLELNVRLATPSPQEIADCCTKLGGKSSDLVGVQLAASRVEAAFEKKTVDELRARPGSPLASEASAPLALVAEWALLAARTKELEAFMVKEFRPEANGQAAVLSLEKAQNVLRYQILPAALQNRFRSLGTLFSLLQEHKAALYMEDFQICQTSLEQVFNKFATAQAAQSGAQPPPAAAPAPPAPVAPVAPVAPAPPPPAADADEEPAKAKSPQDENAEAPITVVAATRPTPPGTPQKDGL